MEEPAQALARHQREMTHAQEAHQQATTEEMRKVAAARIDILHMAADIDRGEMLPQSCRDALQVLVSFATDEWLGDQPPPHGLEHRRWYRDHCSRNIEVQLLGTIFHPRLGPEAHPISGHPGGPDSDPRTS